MLTRKGGGELPYIIVKKIEFQRQSRMDKGESTKERE